MCFTAKSLKSDSNDVTPVLYAAFKTQTSFDSLCYSVPMLDMYDDDGNLSTIGWIGFICTWVGFICLVVGVFWGIDMHRKLRMQWRRTRGGGGAARGAGAGVNAGSGSSSAADRRGEPLLEAQA